MRRGLRALTRHPLISVVLPVFNPNLTHLAAAIASVRAQLYPNWELCIADDASTDPAVVPVLRKVAAGDSRIKLTVREQNGHIAACSNSALALATGEWIALVDQDDILPEHALAVVAATSLKYPDSALIYSDEDKVDESGERCLPYFKSDWNSELLLGQNCISHFGVYRHSLVREVSGFREGFAGSQDYDLALRCVERLRAEQIVHIPRVLYHWRMMEGSVAQDSRAKGYAREAARRSIREFVDRNKIEAKVTACAENTEWHRVVYNLPEPAPRVSVIIPTRDRAGLLKNCIASLRDRTDYPSFEVIVVDNDSTDAEAKRYLALLEKESWGRVVSVPGEFNFSRLINRGANAAEGEVLLLLNNDVETDDAGWLRELVSHAVRPEVGAAGARLWFPDGTLQHGGVILGLGGVASHAFHRFPRKPVAPPMRTFMLAQNYSAVTAACMATRKAVFDAARGFDEQLPGNFNDVDFCLRLRESGLQIIWTPYANLIHRESASRSLADLQRNQREIDWMSHRWGEQLLADPYYSPNFTLTLPGFDLAFPPRIAALDQEGSLMPFEEG